MVRILLAALVVPVACGVVSREPDEPASLLLITVDTLRADRVGAYGHAAAETPHLDALAARGVLFENAFTHSPVTLSSHATLLTGRLPFEHGVRSNSLYRLPEEERTLAEVLEEAGYRTAAFVSAAALDHRFGLDQGFSTYDDEVNTPGGGQLIAERSSAAVTDRALAWLGETDTAGPFFLWVHYFDPHHPYAPPEPFLSRFAESPYDGEIAYTDREIGRLLEALEGTGRPALIAVASDHGEGLGEHGEETHGIFVYDSTLRVPLILAGAGVPQGARDVRNPIGLADLMPTILGRLGLPAEAALSGRDLFAGEPPVELYAETYLPRDFYNWSPLRALRSERYKLVEAPAPELYDLRYDPGETRNVFREQRRTAREIASRLDALGAGAAPSESAYEPDEALLSRLKSLGYLGEPGSAERGGPESTLPDPKDRIGIVAEIDEAITLFEDGRFADAEEKLRAILVEDPGNFLATTYRADALFELERSEEAIEAYHDAIAKGRDGAYYRFRLGLLHERLGRYDRAAEELGQAVARDPRSAVKVLERANALLERGEVDGALRYLTLLEEQGSGGAALSLSLAGAWKAKGDLSRAAASYERALAEIEDPERRRDVLKAAAALFGELGQLDRAAALFREAVSLEPDDFESQANLAVTLARAGDLDGALEPLARAVALRPEEVRLLNLKAEIHYQRGELEESRDLLRRSLAVRPDQPRIARALDEVEEKIATAKRND